MLGFTRKEQGVLIFLSVCFAAGMGVRYYQRHWARLPSTPSENIAAVDRDKFPKVSAESGPDTVSIVHINRADLSSLQNVKGLGPVLARRILDFRLQNGPFQSLNDLLKIKGIGEKTFSKISPFLRCD
jgi:comEA protein